MGTWWECKRSLAGVQSVWEHPDHYQGDYHPTVEAVEAVGEVGLVVVLDCSKFAAPSEEVDSPLNSVLLGTGCLVESVKQTNARVRSTLLRTVIRAGIDIRRLADINDR